MNETNSDPYINMARLLGFGGLVPFASCAAIMIQEPGRQHCRVICQCRLRGGYSALLALSIGARDAR